MVKFFIFIVIEEETRSITHINTDLEEENIHLGALFIIVWMDIAPRKSFHVEVQMNLKKKKCF